MAEASSLFDPLSSRSEQEMGKAKEEDYAH